MLTTFHGNALGSTLGWWFGPFSGRLGRRKVGPIHWAIAAGAGQAYDIEPKQQLWGTLGMLRTMLAMVRPVIDFTNLALTVFSVCHCLRVGEAAHIRKVDIRAPGWLSFYYRKTKRQWIPARLGAWGER